MDEGPQSSLERSDILIAAFVFVAIVCHGVLRAAGIAGYAPYPLYAAIILGGTPLILLQIRNIFSGEFASDILAGISIVTAVILGEYLAAAFVVLMLSGGKALEAAAVSRASSVLQALSRRMPQHAHRKCDSIIEDVPADSIKPGDDLVIYPHEICPVDGTVVDGHGSMDEAYLTGEPYSISKGPGSNVLSGALNGTNALTIRAERISAESRYARIMDVMRETSYAKVPMRRLGDRLGAWYTPFAIAIAAGTVLLTGEWSRFLAVLTVATPCPLIIAIPVAVISAISISARRGIIIRDPALLEAVEGCSTIILDKTGTLTLGKPVYSDAEFFDGFNREEVIRWVLCLERYSRHPLAVAFIEAFAATEDYDPLQVTSVEEPPGQGLRGLVQGK